MVCVERLLQVEPGNFRQLNVEDETCRPGQSEAGGKIFPRRSESLQLMTVQI
jgi:hypothetical protein